MTLRHFTIFIAVCENLNMTKAAATLHMTQPSVSQAIHELEEHYQLRLFERLGHRLFLTRSGHCLLDYANQILSLNRQAESAMKALQERYTLRIGASVTVGESVLIDLLFLAAKLQPQQKILSEVHNTAELEAMLLKDNLDLALVEGDIRSEYIKAIPFMHDELIFIASPDNPLTHYKKVQPADLSGQAFFVRKSGSGTRKLFEDVMANHHLAYEVIGTYNNAETLKKAVMAGLGISVISRRAVQQELAAGKLASFTVDTLTFQRTFRIVYHRNKYLSPEMTGIIQLCHELDNK